MKKIPIAWAPNAGSTDVLSAFSLFFRPWKWFGNKDVLKLEKILGEYVGQEVVAFDSGRSALFALFESFGIGKDDEVLLQGFTCVALPNPILWSGATPIYVDIDLDNLNIDIEDFESKITEKSKAIIIQYTFGISPDMAKIKDICERHNLLLIEDCCHNLGQQINVNGKRYKAGTIGDAAIYSMGMEKIISATRGGFATVNKKVECGMRNAGGINSEEVIDLLRKEQPVLRKHRMRDVFRGIANPIVWKAKEKLGGIGNLIYKLAVKVKIQELGLTKLELVGKKSSWLPYSMPNSNAVLGLKQIGRIDEFNEHRRVIAEMYFEKLNDGNQFLTNADLGSKVEGVKCINKDVADKYADAVWLRFPMIVENADQVRVDAEKKGIYLGNWYTEVIHCKDVDLDAMKYRAGSCPKVEWLIDRSINLPTQRSIKEDDIQRILDTVLG